MPVHLQTNFDPAREVTFTTREIMRQVGLLAREIIVRRTRQGIASDGAPFQPYSAGYATQKAKALGSAAPVDLTVSGAMLNAITIIETTDNTVTLGFSG